MNIKITSLFLIAAAAAGFIASCSEDNAAQTSRDMSSAALAAQTDEAQPDQTVNEAVPSLAQRVTPEPTPVTADTTAPFLLSITRAVTLTVGDDFSIDNYISYIDDRDPEVDIEIAGEVDTGHAGTYPVSFTLFDDAGNSCSDSVTVTVVNPVTPAPSNPEDEPVTVSRNTTGFSEFTETYTGGNIHYGIDVSSWQGDIDFEAVRDAGCEFVIIRAGYSSEGVFNEDSKFAANIQNAQSAGLSIGVYVYSTDNSVEAVEMLADTVCGMIDGYNVTMPVVFDWESFGRFQQYKMSIEDLNDLYRAFEARVNSNGKTAILYSSKYFLDVIWDDSIGPVWLAHYTSQTDYTGSFCLWQQSCTGSIPGIDADVDLDIYYGYLM